MISTHSTVKDKAGHAVKTNFFQRSKRINRLFLVTVLLPTLAAILYYGLIASDVYISEASFVVRTPERGQVATSLGSFLQATGFSSDRIDSFAVQNFILSRDALRQLDERFNLRQAFSNPDIDFLNRFPGPLWWRTSFEDLHRYYQQNITAVQVDSLSSISSPSTHGAGLSADDAVRINQQLLVMGESLVNQLNERGMQDMIRFAADEVAIAEQKAKAAAWPYPLPEQEKRDQPGTTVNHPTPADCQAAGRTHIHPGPAHPAANLHLRQPADSNPAPTGPAPAAGNRCRNQQWGRSDHSLAQKGGRIRTTRPGP